VVIKLKKIIFLALLLAMVAGGGGPVFAGDIVSTISGGVLSLTTTEDRPANIQPLDRQSDPTGGCGHCRAWVSAECDLWPEYRHAIKEL